MFNRKSNELYILQYTRVFDTTQEKLDIRVSLPDTATKEEITEAMNKMVYAGYMRLEQINTLELAAQKEDVKMGYGETEKNAANREKIKDSAKKSN